MKLFKGSNKWKCWAGWGTAQQPLVTLECTWQNVLSQASNRCWLNVNSLLTLMQAAWTLWCVTATLHKHRLVCYGPYVAVSCHQTENFGSTVSTEQCSLTSGSGVCLLSLMYGSQIIDLILAHLLPTEAHWGFLFRHWANIWLVTHFISWSGLISESDSGCRMSVHFCSNGGSVVFFDLQVVLVKLRDVLRFFFPAIAGLGVSSELCSNWGQGALKAPDCLGFFLCSWLVLALSSICTVLALVCLQGFCFWPTWAVGGVLISVVVVVGIALRMGTGWWVFRPWSQTFWPHCSVNDFC